ncbi:TPA: hypothetical protein ACWCF1_004156 [Escherichia coli]
MAKNFVDGISSPGLLKRDVVTPAPGKSTAGNRPQGWRQEGRLLRHQAQFPHTPSGVQGAQVTARQGRRDRNGRCKPGFHASDRSGSPKPRQRVRRRLAGAPAAACRSRADDRMPPGSREPKRVPASGRQNNRNDKTEKCLTP